MPNLNRNNGCVRYERLQSTSGHAHPHRHTVLVVAEDAVLRDWLDTALRLAGFIVHVAADDASAVREIDRRLPDVLVLDVKHPVTGSAALQSLLQMDERTRRLPIIITTSTHEQPPFPVAASLLKPIAADALVTTLFDVIARSEAESTGDDGGALRPFRTVMWVCPRCKYVVRQTMEPGHAITSEMRVDSSPCQKCQA